MRSNEMKKKKEIKGKVRNKKRKRKIKKR